MVRSFTLRDLSLVRRLSEKGISLHAESALTDNLQPFWGAMLNIVVRGEYPTFVLKSGNREGSGFIQILIEEDLHHAHILYLSPAVELPQDGNQIGSASDAWLSLLDQAVIEVGQQGIHSLVAEVAENGPELPILRRAGFAVYARQDIWTLDVTKSKPSEDFASVMLLQPRRPRDDWDIQLFYANTVPRLVQLVEPVPPIDRGDTWILRDEHNELVAFAHIHEGNIATWLRFFIHPSVEGSAGDIVRMALSLIDSQDKRPVYCCVRRYEGWLPAVLEMMNFELWGSQAVMVKHTVQHTKHQMPSLEMQIDSSGLPVSTPTYPALDHYYQMVGMEEGEQIQNNRPQTKAA
ncbi:MAG: hypothetical protein R3293_21180 [Candidatus Promineifilaceae bacterium]|nr:hypothetical protein [Candidatus Promineifilaceae bacterium]